MKTLALAVALTFSLLAQPAPCAAAEPDVLDEALALAGLERADLGWRPRGYWARFPAQIPYKLRCFDDLFAEPLATVPFTRTMGRSARLLLDPARLGERNPQGVGQLFQAVHALGVDPKFGGNRSYAANLTAEATPLAEAILRMYDRAGRATEFVTFGQASPYPLLERDLAEAAGAVPDDVGRVVGKLVLNLLDAQHWAEMALRRVPMQDRVIVGSRMNIGEEQTDALEYCPQIDDVALTFDEPSMWYAALKATQALDEARQELQALQSEAAFHFAWRAPQGWVIVNDCGDNAIDEDDAWLIVDLGGADVYRGSVASAHPLRSLGCVLDLAGDDIYRAGEVGQGAGMCGVGMLLDVAGDDVYEAATHAQGLGQFGLGACIDLAGDDTYFARYSAQGCGYFGVGLLFDCAGADEYLLYADGQGLGGVAGVGVLADHSGDDRYEAVRDAAVSGRPSYHSNLKLSVSNAQGVSMGRRGDGADGHSWAGGLGALLDIGGADTYLAGNWSQGCGYWFGMGALYDGDGDDRYSGAVWSQASGAHFCIGVLLDERGNDEHVAEENATNSLAFGHDFTIAILANLGGDDRYIIENSGLGFSINRSVAMLIDIGGDDEYLTNAANRPGTARYDEARMLRRDDVSTYFADSTSLGFFLDVGGEDVYGIATPHPARHVLLPLTEEQLAAQARAAEAHPDGILSCSNDRIWLDPIDSPNWQVRNFSIGVDREAGAVSFLPIPEKPVPSVWPVPSAAPVMPR